MNIILGAGLSGLICGALNAQAHIYERNPSTFVGHRAVLRFRDVKIARALGLTFRSVTVRKAIWFDGGERSATPRLANWYSRKTRGVVADNSTWNLASAERFIAPDNLHAILADICGGRVHWEHEVTAAVIREAVEQKRLVVSTIPLPALLKLLSIPEPFAFRYSPISVARYNVPDCDIFQTVYFPDPALSIYRATLTGSLLTIEGSSKLDQGELEEVIDALGLSNVEIDLQMLAHRQSYGKITPVPNRERQNLLHRLTVQEGVYSLGRFATWRNILLDDVYEDIAAIRRMMSLTHYEATIERTKS